VRGLRWVALGVVVLGGAAARVALLDVPMRYDEAGTFTAYATQPVSFITSFYNVPNNQILHTLLVHFSWRALGNHVWAIRLPALLAGIALIPATYLAARALYDRWAGIWAAALVAGSGPLMEYSTNARGYMVGLLLIVLSLWCGARVLDGAAPVAWIAIGLLWAAAVYTVPTMAFGAAAVALWMAATAIVRRDWRKLFALAFTGLASALLALLLYSAVLGQGGWSAVPTAGRDLDRLGILATRVGEEWTRTAVHPIDWLVAIAFLAALPLHRRIARHTLPIGVVAAAVVALVVLLDEVAPFSRTFLYLLPLLMIQAAGALSWACGRLGDARRPLVAAVGSVVVAAALVAGELSASQNGTETPPASDNDIVALVRAHLGRNEAVLLPDPEVKLAALYYFQRENVGPPGLPVRHRPYRALIVVPTAARRGWFDAPPTYTNPAAIVASAGWRVRPGGGPHLVVRREYVSLYEAAVD
jgi:uncharacterized membrane protein